MQLLENIILVVKARENIGAIHIICTMRISITAEYIRGTTTIHTECKRYEFNFLKLFRFQHISNFIIINDSFLPIFL